MKDMGLSAPLEKKVIPLQVNGVTKILSGIDKSWIDVHKRYFSKYISHPQPINGQFILGEKERWLELMLSVREDLEWLLQQQHHVFWSYMIHCSNVQQLLISFLQEAPPYYLRNEFPKDEAMEIALEKVEYLVFLVFVRLSTEQESESCYIENPGELLYQNYCFTVPILLDICLIYGINNRDLVAKMLNYVIDAEPQYLRDFQEVLPHFLKVLSIIKKKIEYMKVSKTKDNQNTSLKTLRDLILLLHDAVASIQIFLDIYAKGSKLFRTDSFAFEVSYFYSCVIPKIYDAVKKFRSHIMWSWSPFEKLDTIRLHLLSIVRSVFCSIINDVLNSFERRDEYANEYLSKTTAILQESLFLGDYNSIYPIDADLKILREVCENLDMENLEYISKAILTQETGQSTEVTGVNLKSLIAEVKDILPHLGDNFIEACIKHYNFNTERVIAAVLENKLPDELKNANVSPDGSELKNSGADRSTASKNKRLQKEKQDAINLLNDKSDLGFLRDRYANLSLVCDDNYEDEYDDTYDGQDVSIRAVDDADEERRPFVTPRILRVKEDSEEEEDNDGDPDEEPKRGNDQRFDQFVANPAEIREKYERKRLERTKREFVGRGRGRGQDRETLINRNFKETHKSYIANHNRRRLASKKRNMPFINS